MLSTLYMELLPKMYGKIKNPEFTSEIQCFGALQSPFRVWFQKIIIIKKKTFLDVGCKMGLDGFLVLEDRALMDFVNQRESAEA